MPRTHLISDRRYLHDCEACSNIPSFPFVSPYRLTDEERELVEKIHYSFMNSEKLKKHMRCLFTYGGMYLVSNSNLLYHASVPLNEDGSFKHVKIRGKDFRTLERVYLEDTF